MLNKIRSVIYHTTNLNEAKEWYKKVTNTEPYFDDHFMLALI